MPRPVLPPTPEPASDIKGKDGNQQLASLHLAIELPPPAFHDADSSKLSPTSTSRPPHSLNTAPPPRACFPMQAAETVKARRRPSALAKGIKEDAFALPPPPTRSRKIIQMKPRVQGKGTSLAFASKEPAKTGGGKSTAATKTSGAGSGSATGSGAGAGLPGGKGEGKKKQPSATSVAGRKVARKTAHSLIERRRRSKMNEEFALLKSMIPACTGEMHKLSILQASIEYVRYLEDCVAGLKEQQVQAQHSLPGSSQSALPSIREFHPTFYDDDDDDNEDDDNNAAANVEMNDSGTASPAFAPRRPSASPTLFAEDSRYRNYSHSYSSPATTNHRHHSYSYSYSAAASPAFEPQCHFGVVGGGSACSHSSTSASGSTLTSPGLNPQSDLDQEATAALLMLNSDRRGPTGSGRGLSVRDLLSS